MKPAFMVRLLLVAVTATLVLTAPSSTSAQTQTVGLFINDTASYSGYTFWAPMTSKTAYLIGPNGRQVRTWTSAFNPGADVYFLPDGHLLWPDKIAVTGGHLQEFDWDGNLVWEWQDEDPAYLQHHDIEPLPNGNVLVLTNYHRTGAEAIAAGRDTLKLASDTVNSITIFEIHPTGPSTGEIVWKWQLWDHLIQDFDSTKANYGVLAEHPELFDINLGDPGANWVHANAVAYNPQLDQVIVSFRTVSEIYVIDHSTTTAEAAGHTGGAHGHGGDFLYRWGNPQNYGAGTVADQMLDHQHDPAWIAEGLPGSGHILVFNNGNVRGYSSVDEFAPPVDANGDYTWPSPGEPFGPSGLTWTWRADPVTNFYATSLSGAQRLPNGNTLIDDGPKAHFFEVTTEGKLVWDYRSPVAPSGPVQQGSTPSLPNVFRAYRFGSDYAGLAGHDLSPTVPVEGYPIEIGGSATSPSIPVPSDTAILITAEIRATQGTLTSAVVQANTGNGYQPFVMYDDGLTATARRATASTARSCCVRRCPPTSPIISRPRIHSEILLTILPIRR